MSPGAARWLTRADVGACLLVLALAGALYGRTVGFELTRTDDRVLIVDDAHFIKDLSRVGEAFSRPFFPVSRERSQRYYRPLVTISLMLDAARGGTEPRAYHLTNVVLHALASALLVLALRAMRFSLPLSLGGALVFAVHPAMTEAVAWIPGRCDTLLGVFVLCGVIAFMRYVASGSRLALALHGVALLAALFTKEAALVLPFGLALWVSLVERRAATLRSAAVLLAWAIPLAVWLVSWSRVAGLGEEGPGTRLAVTLEHAPALLVYLGKIVAPVELAVLATLRDSSVVIGALAVPALAVVVKLLSGRERAVALWGLAWFGAFLLPSLPVSDFLILENRLYVPTFGLLALLIVATAAAIRRFTSAEKLGWTRPWAARSGAALGVLLLLGLGRASWRYSEVFRDPDSFTRAAVTSSPHCGLAQLNRGIVFQLRGDLEQAERAYLRARSLDPGLGVVQNNLGLIYLRRGDLSRAEQLFRAELVRDPGYPKAHHNLGLVLERTGRLGEALRSFEQAHRIDPHDIPTLQHLQVLHSVNGNAERALQYERALRQHGAQPLAVTPMGQDR